MDIRKIIPVALATLFATSPISDFAATQSANFQAQATLNATCILFTTNVNFGTVSPSLTGFNTANGIITVLCTRGTNYTMQINSGSSNSFATRSMTGQTSGNTDKLNYNLYTDTSYTRVLGDGTTSTYDIQGSGTGNNQYYTMYGGILLNQFLRPDSYTDNLVITMTY